jgi:hypothetical protein
LEERLAQAPDDVSDPAGYGDGNQCAIDVDLDPYAAGFDFLAICA